MAYHFTGTSRAGAYRERGVHMLCVFVYIIIYLSVYIYIHICIHIYIYMYICVCVYGQEFCMNGEEIAVRGVKGT